MSPQELMRRLYPLVALEFSTGDTSVTLFASVDLPHAIEWTLRVSPQILPYQRDEGDRGSHNWCNEKKCHYALIRETKVDFSMLILQKVPHVDRFLLIEGTLIIRIVWRKTVIAGTRRGGSALTKTSGFVVHVSRACRARQLSLLLAFSNQVLLGSATALVMNTKRVFDAAAPLPKALVYDPGSPFKNTKSGGIMVNIYHARHTASTVDAVDRAPAGKQSDTINPSTRIYPSVNEELFAASPVSDDRLRPVLSLDRIDDRRP
ncbi:hypothetical protein C8R48DRAFT_789590 [Suillus tomentosus]|nr:hypothetical protein C8R48DRAFT_789590 [Suillus tomentosus]